MISGKSIEGEGYLRRVSGGVLADGVNSFISGIFNSFPNSIFAQNKDYPADGSRQPVRRVLYSGYADPVGFIPGCRRYLLLDARSGAGRGYPADVRYGGGSRYPYYRRQDINRKATLVLAVSLSLGLGWS